MKMRQITVGFDVSVSVEEVAEVLAAAFGSVDVGQGISSNGLPPGYVYVRNQKARKKNV
jgi:hypothetical protein